jgi:uncharacterized protein (DUF2225 family)
MINVGELLKTPDKAKELFEKQPEVAYTIIKMLYQRLAAGGVSMAPKTAAAPKAADTQKTADTPKAADTPKTAAEALTAQKREAQKPEREEIDIGASKSPFSLFPPGHGTYEFPLEEQNRTLLLDREQKCPICGHTFKTPLPRASKLVNIAEDPDLRIHYRDIEPMYYTIVTCPDCWFSATQETFSRGIKRKRDLMEKKLGDFKAQIHIETNSIRDSFSIFAGHYIALLCAETVMPDRNLLRGAIWLRLSRLYDDCGDAAMVKFCCTKALEIYLDLYLGSECQPGAEQRICFIIGDLAYKTGDYKLASKFFFTVKTDKSGTAALKQKADLRLDDVKAAEGAAGQ